VTATWVDEVDAEIEAAGGPEAVLGDLGLSPPVQPLPLRQVAAAANVGTAGMHAIKPAPSPAPSAEPEIVSAFTLLQNFKPIESIIDGLPVGRGALVAITGSTGSGKTTLCGELQIAFCRGLPVAGREVTAGSVLVLAGENPHDYTMHLVASLQAKGLTASDLSRPPPMGELLVVPGTFAIDFELGHLRQRIADMGTNLVAVFVDTSAAFYSADDENDNVAMRRHASTLRELTTLPGNPTVFVLCHPTKNPQRDNLLPRGGGAFLAEIDSNLTLFKDEAGIVTLHHAGKIRGPSFDPIRFELVQVELDGHKDCRGRPIFSTATKHVPDDRAEQIEAKALDDENRLIVAMQRKPGASVADLAMAAGMTTGAGSPQKSRVHRLLLTLAEQGLAKKNRTGVWHLTTKGSKEADDLP
jgi:hypothetical protein